MTTSRCRAFTLVELMITTALMAMVIGTLASLYLYAVIRTSHGVTEVATLLQAQELLDRMEVVISQAADCQLVTSGPVTGLKCTMPLSGVDRDGDGILDSYTPNSVSRRQIAKFTRGLRVWFYQSDSSGNFGTAGTTLYLASRGDDSNPVLANTKSGFSNTGGDVYRWNLVDSVSFAVDTPRESVRISVRASSLVRDDAASAGAAAVESRDNYVVNLSRTVCWRNWWR